MKKNLMRLAGFWTKSIKVLSSKILLVSKMFIKKINIRKVIQFSKAEVVGNFDITLTNIHVQRFTGHVYDWSILNDRPTQKNWQISLPISTWRNFCNIAKYLIHAVPNFKSVKLRANILFLCAYLNKLLKLSWRQWNMPYLK